MFNLPYTGPGGKLLWQEMWRHELEEAAKNGTVVILPTGSVEQRGPHCPMDVNIISSFSIAVETAMKAQGQTIVTPPVWFGFAHYNKGFAGTSQTPFSKDVQKFMPGWGALGERRRDTEKGTGTMGNPTAASAEKGRAVVDAARNKLAMVVKEYHDLPVRRYKAFGSYSDP